MLILTELETYRIMKINHLVSITSDLVLVHKKNEQILLTKPI